MDISDNSGKHSLRVAQSTRWHIRELSSNDLTELNWNHRVTTNLKIINTLHSTWKKLLLLHAFLQWLRWSAPYMMHTHSTLKSG